MSRAYTAVMRKNTFWGMMLVVVALYLVLSFWGTSLMDLTPIQSETSDLQARVEILRSLTEAIAIVIAGIWAYEVYIRNRYDHPYPKIQHCIEHHDLENGIVYLSVFVTVTNEGKTKLDLVMGEIHVRRVKPLTPELLPLIEWGTKNKRIREGDVPELFNKNRRTVNWREFGYRKWEWEKLEQRGKNALVLEPGQVREIQFDFFLPQGLEIVQVLSIFRYEDTFWELSTLYSMKERQSIQMTNG
jgi:hypothetical protein